MEDTEYDNSNNADLATYPIMCSALRKNGYVMLKGRPCKIMDMITLNPDHNRDIKVHIVGLDIFTNTKYEELWPSTHTIEVPNVKRSDFQLIDISDDGLVTLMNHKGDTRDDIRLPGGELGTKIRDEFGRDDNTVIVTVMSAVGEEAIIACKNASA